MNKVYNESWTNLSRYPDGYFDWVIADVPYGIGVGKMAYLKENGIKVKQKNGSRIAIKKKQYAQKDWDNEVPRQDYIDEVKRVSNNQIIFGVEYADWKGIGEGRIKWNKGFPDGVSFKKYEMAYCSAIEYTHEINLLWAGMQQAKSLSEPMTPQGNKKLNEKRIHPTQKPILLYKRILLDFVKEGMRICDTHNGSGSLRIAADLYNCDFIGFETDKGHFDDQEKRYKEFKGPYRLW